MESEKITNDKEKPDVLSDHSSDNNDIILNSGDELIIEELSQITKKNKTRIVILAGLAESGKTTILSSIFDHFQWGLFENYFFNGSKTLPGFERRCFLSRDESGLDEEDTGRTIGKYESFLHLDLKKDLLSLDRLSLLISDISAEKIDQLRDSTIACKEYIIIKRTDHFSVVYNCEDMVNKTRRYLAKQYGKSLIRSCVDAEMLTKDSHLELLFTKWDKVSGQEKNEDSNNFILNIENEIQNEFGHKIGKIKSFKLACRNTFDPKLQNGYGLKELFNFWINESPFICSQNEHSNIRQLTNREFQNFNPI